MISSGGTGRAKRNPCPSRHPRSRRNASSASASRSPRRGSSSRGRCASSRNADTMLAACGSLVHVTDERTVDLQDVDRHLTEPRQRRVSRSRSRRSRSRKPASCRSQSTRWARSGSIIAEVSVTSTSTVDGSTPAVDDPAQDPLGEVRLPELAGREVEADLELDVELAPCRDLVDELPHDPIADQLDQAELLGQRDELVRRHHRAVGLDPPDQRLDADACARRRARRPAGSGGSIAGSRRPCGVG